MTSTLIPLPIKAGRTAALLLAMLVAPAHADDIRLGGTGAALGTMQILADAYTRQHADTRITVLPSMGSGGGIKAVLAGAIQIGVSARPLKEAEKQAGGAEVEYGRTPFVFATPSAGTPTGITTQGLADIYAGRLEAWPDGSKIRLVLRPLGDSDSETIKSISPALRDAKTAAEQRKGMLFTVTDQETADNLEKIPGALGPTTLALMLSEKRALKALTLDGVMPSAKSVADGSYPLYKQLFIVTSAQPSLAVQGFVSFVRSPAGRDILAQTGHWVKG
jgi:phosphate transport system substrate-binding protein